MNLARAQEKLKAYQELNAMRIDSSEIDRFMEDDREPDYFTDMGSLLEDIAKEFDVKARVSGPRLPFSKTREDFRLRPHELSIWFGIDGHGKSLLMSHVILDLMAQGQRCALASIEMTLPKAAARMSRQAIGNDNPTYETLGAFCRWAQGKLWLYRDPQVFRFERLLAAIRYSVKVLKVQHFVIDNLTSMLRNDDDLSEQKQVVQRLAVMCRDLEVHIHLVAHSRKAEDESRVPTRQMLKGSGSMLAESDNVLIVWKNSKPKLERDPDYPCDAVLVVAKQRHHDGQGRDTLSLGLWLDERSHQFTDYENAPIRRYVSAREPGQD